MSRVGRLPGALLNLLSLTFCGFFVQGSVRDMFAHVPTSEKIDDLILLVPGVVGVGAAGLLIAGVGSPNTRWWAGALEALAVMVTFVAWIWAINDFFSSVGRFG